MNAIFQNKSLKYAFVVFAALVSIEFWSFAVLSDFALKLLQVAVIGVCVIVVFWHSHVFTKTGLRFKANVLLFMSLPFLSTIGAYIYHHQRFGTSMSVYFPNFLWLFYFVLHIFKIEKKKLIKVMIFIGCVWAFLTIVQQFTYPHIYFFSRGGGEDGGEGEDSSIYRAGVYRFMLAGQQFGLFVLLYFFYTYLLTKSNQKIRYLPFIGFALLGFYYYGTRQYALGAAMCMGVAIFMLKPGPRVKYIAIAIPTLALLWALKHVLFGQYIELTSGQEHYGWDQDIRFLCGKFYLLDYWPHWTAKLIGNGLPHASSDYGREMSLILVYFHFYRSDVGLIGSFNSYGIFYILNIFWTIVKAARMRGLRFQDKYLKLFFYNALFLMLLNDLLGKGMVFYCLVMYLMDKSIEERKRERMVLSEDIYAAPELDYT